MSRLAVCISFIHPVSMDGWMDDRREGRTEGAKLVWYGVVWWV